MVIDIHESYDVNAIKAKLFINISKSGKTEGLLKLSESTKRNGIKIVTFTGIIP